MPAFAPPHALLSRRRALSPLSPRRAPRRAPRPVATVQIAGAERATQVLRSLLEANAAYAAGLSPPQAELSSPAIREELAAHGQAPDAAVIACADSRVAPEIIFGAGLGRVFVVRNAGNVAWGDSVVGSLEFAVDVLKVPLVIVLGHTMCGAVGAAVGAAKGKGSGRGPLVSHVGRIAEVIRTELGKPDEVGAAVAKNVRNGVASLLSGDTAVARYAKNGGIRVVGAVYDIHTGKVNVVE